MESRQSQHNVDGGESASEEEMMLMRRYRTIGMTPHGPEVCKRNQKLVEVVPRLSAALDKALRKQHKDFKRLDLAQLEQGWEQLEEARQRDVQMAALTTVNIPNEDADFGKVRQMEAELGWYMTQAVRLHHLCEAYDTEAEKWRQRVKELEGEKAALRRQAFTAKTENELIAAAAEQVDPSEDLAACVFLRKQRPSRNAAKSGIEPPAEPLQPRLQLWQTLRPPDEPAPVSARPGLLRRPLESLTHGQSASAPASARATSRPVPSPRTHATSSAIDMPAPRPLELTRQLETPPAPARSSRLRPAVVSGPFEDAPLARRASSETSRTTEAQDAEAAYLTEIKLLEGRLQRVKNNVRQKRTLQKAAAHLVMGHKEDMERFFLLCMHDLRGDLHRRHSAAAARQACPRGRSQDSHQGKQPSQGESILDLVAGSDHVLNVLYETLFPHRLAASRQHAWDASQSRAFPKRQSSSAAAVAVVDSLLQTDDILESRSLD